MAKNSKLIEVCFKGERRGIYRNRHELEIQEGDWVVVEADRGVDLGRVSLVGTLVRLKRGKGETRNIVRKAQPVESEKHAQNAQREKDLFVVCKQRIAEFNLDMKLVDVEMQFDGSKITFYFTAAQRVDFRELVKSLAAQYRTRIELRQIGVRDEAKRIGGCGICGRSQCCSTFLMEFEQITTQMAKDQQLALNPAKISGNCGRLLCCMRYEHESYVETLCRFPQPGTTVNVGGKEGTLTYINIFRNQALVHFADRSEEWFEAETFQKEPCCHDAAHCKRT